MVVTTSASVTAALRDLGLTDNEARAFVALLSTAGPDGSTGYEVAKQSGVPRAKVYEVLRSLVEKGAALSRPHADRERYVAVDPDLLLRRHVDRATRRAAELGPALERLRGDRPAPTGPGMIKVTGIDAVVAKAEAVADRAATRIFAVGLPRHLERIGPALRRAEDRGVLPYVLSYGPARLPISTSYEKHAVSDDEPRDAGVLWLTVVADNAEALVGQPAPEPTESAVWSDLGAVAGVAAEFVRQQIYGTELSRLVKERDLDLNQELAPLQPMWFNDRLDER